jgi:hypothetical protein
MKFTFTLTPRCWNTILSSAILSQLLNLFRPIILGSLDPPYQDQITFKSNFHVKQVSDPHSSGYNPRYEFTAFMVLEMMNKSHLRICYFRPPVIITPTLSILWWLQVVVCSHMPSNNRNMFSSLCVMSYYTFRYTAHSWRYSPNILTHPKLHLISRLCRPICTGSYHYL